MRLARVGYHVFAGVRKEADGARLVDQVPVGLTPLLIDVTDEASIAAAASTVYDAVGARGLAGLVNNAGISGGGPLEFYPMEDIRRMFETNVFGLIATTQAFLGMIRAGRGRIVCIGSIAARFSQPFVSPYSMTKSAVEALCDALRVELRPWRIKVVCVEPGSIATEIWRKGEEEAEARLRSMPPEALELYGDILPKVVKLAMDAGRRGIPAERVADVVEKALTLSRPAGRYLVGTDARASALVGLIPDRARDVLVSKAIGSKAPD